MSEDSGTAFDPSRPNVARVYDYLLGGKDSFALDRAVGDQIIAALPEVRAGVREQRDLLRRVVRYLVAEAGVDQLLDVGSGLPTADNVHQIARRASDAGAAGAAGTRVVYLDNDPVVLAHARALLTDSVGTFAEEGDLLRPETIIGNPAIRSHLDWDRPVGLLLCGIAHYLLDSDEPARVIGELIDALPPGSYVFIQHLLDTGDPEVRQIQDQMARALGRVRFRTLDEVRALFGGLPLVDPGLVTTTRWRPDPGTVIPAADELVMSMGCAGVAVKR